RHAPLDVCLVLDDVHEIPAGSASARLLSEDVRSLPAHAHLVLAGRGSPPGPLARLTAADRSVEIGPDELLVAALDRAALPAHAHLVLAGRGSSPVPLARLRAADRVVEIGPDELLFSARERARLAAHLGRDPAVADRYGGWPALVRLALAVGDDVSLEYAR